MKCPNCSEVFKATPVDGKVECPSCGKKLKVVSKQSKPEEKKATPVKKESNGNNMSSGAWTCSCGTENVGKFCEECGAKRPEANTEENPFDEVEAHVKEIRKTQPKVAPVPMPEPKKPVDDFDDIWGDYEGNEFDDEDEDEEEDYSITEKGKQQAKKEKAAKQKPVKSNAGAVSGGAMTIADYIKINLITMIPLVGVILLIMFACGKLAGEREEVKTYCLSMLLMAAIGVGLGILLSLVFGAVGAALVGSMLG